MTKHFAGILLATFISGSTAVAQMVGPDCYIAGTSVEVGIDGSGGFEGVDVTVSPNPATYHFRSGGTNYFGFVANPQVNAWATFDGDFFTPGSPENGWGFEVGCGPAISAHNNCSSWSGDGIPGAITGLTTYFDCTYADWEGDATSGTDLHWKITYQLKTNDLYYTTSVSVTNNTSATIPEIYYYKNFDPDNNQPISGSFTTTNTIVSQPSAGCQLAHVSATQSTPWLSYVGLAGVGSNFRVGLGGFSNRDACNMWNGGMPYTAGIGMTSTMDEGIFIAYRIQNLAPGATETFKFVTILDDASASNAIDNLLYFAYPGSAGLPPSECTPYIDTARTCGAPLPLNISGSIAPDYSWSWSPGTGLSSTTGSSVIANPSSTTTYTVSGSPLSACLAPVTLQIVVMVTPGGGNNPYITPVAPVCESSAPFNLTVDSTGGTWTGPGITSSTAGTFDPAAAGPGTHLITYFTTNTCNSTDTMEIVVNPSSNPTINVPGTICASDPAFNLTASSTGGTWSGTGITNPSAGTFDPGVSGGGTFPIIYSFGGMCPTADTANIVVGNVTTPVTSFTYTSPVCAGSSTAPVPVPVPGYTTGGTYSSTPPGLSMNPSTGSVNLGSSTPGTYIITYTVPATVCGPAGSSSDTLVIDPVNVPETDFTYPPACEGGTNILPDTVPGFTGGGTYSAGSGMSINPTTGEIDINSTIPGTYTVTYTVTGNMALCNGSGSSSYVVTINPQPTIGITMTTDIWIGDEAQIWATGGVNYDWSPVLGLTCLNGTCDTLTAAPSETTDYCVTVTDNNGCIDSQCVRINVEIPCPGNRNLGAPNAFSPNNDGFNDEFCLQGWDDCVDEFSIVIFDRWGEKVFEGTKATFCWDGKFKGKLLDPGVYVYFIKARYLVAGATVTDPETLIEINKNGNITLLR